MSRADARMKKSVLPFFLLLILPVAFGQEPTAGQWRFDEGEGNVAKDSSGKNNHGEIVGARWAAGRSGKALAFKDYAADLNPNPKNATFVRVKHSEGLLPKKSFDIAASINIDGSFAPTFAAAIVQKGDGYGCAYRLLLLKDFRVRVAAGNEHSTVDSKTKLAPGSWHALRARYDGARLMLFIDGKEEGSQEIAVKSFANNDDLYIGVRFTGLIDEVKIAVE